MAHQRFVLHRVTSELSVIRPAAMVTPLLKHLPAGVGFAIILAV